MLSLTLGRTVPRVHWQVPLVPVKREVILQPCKLGLMFDKFLPPRLPRLGRVTVIENSSFDTIDRIKTCMEQVQSRVEGVEAM